jgi:hypothetical protein
MNLERIEAAWIEEHRVTLDDLGPRWGLSRSQVQAFVELGILEPDTAEDGRIGFTLESVSVARTACRLQQELELEPHAEGVVLSLLQRLRSLEEELEALRAADPLRPVRRRAPSSSP